MANQEGGKLKLLYMIDLFKEYTDEDHYITVPTIIECLEEVGIHAERKSIYRDLKVLEDYGIELDKDPTGLLSLISRDFELSELKVLVDAVSASKFITKTEAQRLLEKLEKQCSSHQRKSLHRQVVVADRAKGKGNIYYAIDEIHRAIEGNVKLSFTYLQWDENKNLVPTHDGKKYTVSPCFLVWDHEYYYLVALDEDGNKVKHYRVDKILGAKAVEEERNPEVKNVSQRDYSNKRFSMFDGEPTMISFRAPKAKAGIFIDRFGKDITIIKEGDEIFVRAEAAISPQFFGWLTGLGAEVRLEAPSNVVDEYKQFMKEIIKKYK